MVVSVCKERKITPKQVGKMQKQISITPLDTLMTRVIDIEEERLVVTCQVAAVEDSGHLLWSDINQEMDVS